MSVVRWSANGFYKQDPNDVMREIESIGDVVTPRSIVERARDENHFMHDMFEWDDSVAGELYRETQARQIIRMLVVVDEEKKEQPPVRLLVSTGNRDQTYTPVKLIVRNEDAYNDLLSRALSELIAFKRKYSTLVELDEVMRLIDELI